MKILGLLLIITNSYFLFGQNDTIPLICDKVVFKDGTSSFVQVQKVNSRKITYILCCQDCAVPREYKAKDVDTILFSSTELSTIKENNINYNSIVLDSNNKLIETGVISVSKGDKTDFIMVGDKISLSTTNGKFFGGILDSIYTKSIFINGSDIIIDSISVINIKRGGRLAKSFGYTINDTLIYPGSILMSKGNVKHHLMLGDKLTLNTGSELYKGNLDSVNTKSVFMNGEEILIETITSVRFRSKERKRRFKQVFIFGMLDFPFGIGMGIQVFNANSNLGSSFAAAGLAVGLVAAPILATSGIVLLTKKNMKIDNGWELKVIK